jgi:hypothetical protein
MATEHGLGLRAIMILRDYRALPCLLSEGNSTVPFMRAIGEIEERADRLIADHDELLKKREKKG